MGEFHIDPTAESSWLCKENLDPELSQCLWIRNCCIQAGVSALSLWNLEQLTRPFHLINLLTAWHQESIQW